MICACRRLGAVVQVQIHVARCEKIERKTEKESESDGKQIRSLALAVFDSAYDAF